MATAKTWLWIVLGFVGVCLLGLFVVAGAGVYFVAHHFDAARTASADALRTFDDARATFKGQRPLLELDPFDRPRATRPITELPTSAIKPQNLWILAWNPDDERLVKISLPFWLLRLGRRKMDFSGSDAEFDLERLNLDAKELERVGPALVLDYRLPTGRRVLIWTQ